MVETWQRGTAVIDSTNVPFQFLSHVSVDRARYERKDCCRGRRVKIDEQAIGTGAVVGE